MRSSWNSGLGLVGAVAAAVMISAASQALAADSGKHISDGAAKGQATEGVAPAHHCPTGQTAAPDGKCVTPDSINYNASKSNTGAVRATPPVFKNHDSASPN